MSCPRTEPSVFVARRRALAAKLRAPALIAAGEPPARQYRANTYPFRARSHFLYLVGEHIPAAALLVARGRTVLFVEPEGDGDALWHGPRPSLEELRDKLAVDEVRALADASALLAELGAPACSLPTDDARSAAWLSARLGRAFAVSGGDKLEEGSADAELADAMIALRLVHDEAAIAQLRAAAEASARAHLAGMRATRPGGNEADVAAAMIAALRREGFEDAYGPIVTVHGEVLHNERHDGALAAGDLLLADVGAETPEGWAGDVTRVWPVVGRLLADAARDLRRRARRAARRDRQGSSGHRYRDVHETAKRRIVEGLVDLGIFRGDVDGLLERGAAAIFFPHGVGHLLGLDVHDMEDLGDRAGYAPGRARSKAFGDRYLRLDRDLAPGMAVTIEPGFYQVPAILADAALRRRRRRRSRSRRARPFRRRARHPHRGRRALHQRRSRGADAARAQGRGRDRGRHARLTRPSRPGFHPGPDEGLSTPRPGPGQCPGPLCIDRDAVDAKTSRIGRGSGRARQSM